MKQIYIILTLMFFILNEENINAQTVWTGTTVTFTKVNNADWTLETNQDRITTNTWITRKNNQSIFNIVTETGSSSSSPSDTEWAFGTTADIATLAFDSFNNTHGFNPTSMINLDMVLHLITDNIFIDIKFTSFSGGNAGGGFSYERSTDQNLSTDKFQQDKEIRLLPNPSSNSVYVSGLTEEKSYSIYNNLGTEIKSGTISDKEEIGIQDFTNGLYFLKLNNGNTFKFIKK